MAVTRDEVVRAAIGLLDEAGLDGLTLRRLAQRLGIRAPTLYWHVRDKRELLDLIADAIIGQALDGLRSPRPGQPWWEWLADMAREQRAALLAHRDSARVLAGNTPVQQALPAIEQEVRALADAGFTPSDALMTLRAVGAYVIGDVADVQGEDERARLGANPAGRGQGEAPPAPEPGAATSPGELGAAPRPGRPSPRSRRPYSPGAEPGPFSAADFPLLVAASTPQRTSGERFEHGLGLIIGGLRAQLAAPR